MHAIIEGGQELRIENLRLSIADADDATNSVSSESRVDGGGAMGLEVKVHARSLPRVSLLSGKVSFVLVRSYCKKKNIFKKHVGM